MLNRWDEAIAIYDVVLKRFSEATDPTIRGDVAYALVNKAYDLRRLDRHEEAMAVYGDVLTRFGEMTEPAIREQLARALVGKGTSLEALKRHDEAIAVYDEVVRRFADATEPLASECVAQALVNKANLLCQLARSEEAVAVCDELQKRLGTPTEPALREFVAMALIYKGIAFLQLKKDEQARELFLEVVEYWATDLIVESRLDRIIALAGLQRFDDAQQLLEHLVSKRALDLAMGEDLLSDLELLASVPQVPEGVRNFVEHARRTLDPLDRTRRTPSD